MKMGFLPQEHIGITVTNRMNWNVWKVGVTLVHSVCTIFQNVNKIKIRIIRLVVE